MPYGGNVDIDTSTRIPTTIGFLFAELDPEQIQQGNKGVSLIAANLTGIGGCHVDVWLWGQTNEDRNKLCSLIKATCQTRPIDVIHSTQKVCQWLRKEGHWNRFQENWRESVETKDLAPPALQHLDPLIWGNDEKDRSVRLQRLQEWNRNAADGYPVLRFTKEVQATTVFKNHIREAAYSIPKEALAGLLMVVPRYQMALEQASGIKEISTNNADVLLQRIAILNAANKELRNKSTGNQ
jgi:hypothetical protein